MSYLPIDLMDVNRIISAHSLCHSSYTRCQLYVTYACNLYRRNFRFCSYEDDFWSVVCACVCLYFCGQMCPCLGDMSQISCVWQLTVHDVQHVSACVVTPWYHLSDVTTPRSAIAAANVIKEMQEAVSVTDPRVSACVWVSMCVCVWGGGGGVS